MNIDFKDMSVHTFTAATLAAFAMCVASDHKLQSSLNLKFRAAEMAKRAFDHIAKARAEQGLAFCERDIGKTGLIGLQTSIITTNRGYLRGKRAALNPNYAALVIDWLEQLKIGPGDRVAVAITGSHPALNICVYAALSAMRIEPAIIASLGSSNWGANDPRFCWLDMEKSLFDANIIPFRAHLYSVGGNGDCGKNLTEEGRNWASNKIMNSDRSHLLCENSAQSVQKRLAFYQEFFNNKKINLYINLGGGVASVSRREKKLLSPGLNLKPAHAEKELSDSVMQRLGAENTPSIHLNNVTDLAAKYGFGLAEDGKIAPVGEGSIFELPKTKKFKSWAISAVALLSLAHAGGKKMAFFHKPHRAKN